MFNQKSKIIQTDYKFCLFITWTSETCFHLNVQQIEEVSIISLAKIQSHNLSPKPIQTVVVSHVTLSRQPSQAETMRVRTEDQLTEQTSQKLNPCHSI